MKEYKVSGHVSSFLPEGKEWKLIWNDEFDGNTLDETKWDYRLHIMGKRFPTYQKEGVRLDGNSNVVFTTFEKDGEICTTQLQTGYNYLDEPPEGEYGGGLVWPIAKIKEPKFMHKYGYWECRCKLQKKPGWWSAFWLQSPLIGSTLNPEVSGIENDIMESFEVGKTIPHMNHYNGYGADHQYVEHGETMNLSLDEYHTFGLMWDENGYTFYVDGKEDGHSSFPVSKTEQFILLTTEAYGYRLPQKTATKEARESVGDEFIVDYVRVFDEIK